MGRRLRGIDGRADHRRLHPPIAHLSIRTTHPDLLTSLRCDLLASARILCMPPPPPHDPRSSRDSAAIIRTPSASAGRTSPLSKTDSGPTSPLSKGGLRRVLAGRLRSRFGFGGAQRRFSGVSRRASGQPFYGWSADARSLLSRAQPASAGLLARCQSALKRAGDQKRGFDPAHRPLRTGLRARLRREDPVNGNGM